MPTEALIQKTNIFFDLLKKALNCIHPNIEIFLKKLEEKTTANADTDFFKTTEGLSFNKKSYDTLINKANETIAGKNKAIDSVFTEDDPRKKLFYKYFWEIKNEAELEKDMQTLKEIITENSPQEADYNRVVLAFANRLLDLCNSQLNKLRIFSPSHIPDISDEETITQMRHTLGVLTKFADPDSDTEEPLCSDIETEEEEDEETLETPLLPSGNRRETTQSEHYRLKVDEKILNKIIEKGNEIETRAKNAKITPERWLNSCGAALAICSVVLGIWDMANEAIDGHSILTTINHSPTISSIAIILAILALATLIIAAEKKSVRLKKTPFFEHVSNHARKFCQQARANLCA